MSIEMYTDRQVAKLFDLASKRGYVTIQRMARDGTLRGVKVGDRWRFSKQSIEDLLAGGKRRI